MTQTIKMTLFLIALLFSTIVSAKGFDRGIKNTTFIPKGQWLVGGNFSYSESENENYKILIMDEYYGEGYTFKVSPYFGYFFRNNVCAGFRVSYNRSYTSIDDLSIDIMEDMNFSLSDIKRTEHMYKATGFLRTYINLGNSKRFGLFNEVRLTYGMGESKQTDGVGVIQTGTYEDIIECQVGMAPGLTAFVADFAAVEVSVGVLGFDVRWTNQTTNQVEEGYRRKSSGNFKIDLFSLSLGMAFYI